MVDVEEGSDSRIIFSTTWPNIFPYLDSNTLAPLQPYERPHDYCYVHDLSDGDLERFCKLMAICFNDETEWIHDHPKHINTLGVGRAEQKSVRTGILDRTGPGTGPDRGF